MTGEIRFFRKRFFGGFNREDVVDYVSKLARERNESRDAKDAAEEEARLLAFEAESIRLELENTKKTTDESLEAKDKAESEAKVLNDEMESLRSEISSLHNEIESHGIELWKTKQEAHECREAKDRAEQETQNLLSQRESLYRELEEARRAADEGQQYKAEALEARSKIAVFETAKRAFTELEPAINDLRAIFEDTQ